MRIIAILALAAAAVWAAKSGKLNRSSLKKSNLGDLKSRAMNMGGNATDDASARADDAERVRAATH
jgi:hypothetical protein